MNLIYADIEAAAARIPTASASTDDRADDLREFEKACAQLSLSTLTLAEAIRMLELRGLVCDAIVACTRDKVDRLVDRSVIEAILKLARRASGERAATGA